MKILFVVMLLALAVGCGKAAERLDSKLQARASGANVGYAEGVAMTAPAVMVDSYGGYDGDYEDEAVAYEVAYSKVAMPYPEPMPPVYYEEEPELNLDRKVIKNAQMSVEVTDYEAAQIKVMNLAQKYSGFVSGSNSYKDNNGKLRGHVSIRIPSIHFDAALIEAGAVGQLLSQSISGDDVTENYYDTAARLNNSKREEGRLIKILEKAEDVDDILRIERELARVRGDVERAEGRLRYLDNHVSFSSITVDLQEPSPVVKKYGIYDAIKDAVNLFLATVRFLIRALGFLLPLIILGTIAAVIIIWRVRKHRKRK